MDSKHTLGEFEKCSKMVSGTGRFGSFHQHQCSFTAVVKIEGKGYCKKHDPAYIEEKFKEDRKKFDLESKERQRKFQLEQVAPELLRLLKISIFLFDKDFEEGTINITLLGK